ncbi:TcfC E-set like domain-containing protein [Vibrio astriarenae]
MLLKRIFITEIVLFSASGISSLQSVSATETRDSFLEEYYRQPIALETYVGAGGAPGFTGMYKAESDGNIVLLDVLSKSGEVPEQLIHTLHQGINVNHCDKVNDAEHCGLIDKAALNIEQTRLSLSYPQYVTVTAPSFDGQSLLLNNFVSFSERSGTWSADGVYNYNGQRVIATTDVNSQREYTEVNVQTLKYRHADENFQLDLGLIDTGSANSGSLATSSSDSRNFVGIAVSNESDLKRHHGSYDIGNDIILELNDSSVVEVYYQGRQIDTQYMSRGLKRLSVKNYPKGNYTVEIKIREDSGREYERSELVFNSNNDNKLTLGAAIGHSMDYSHPYASAYLNSTLFKVLRSGVHLVLDNGASNVSANFTFNKEQLFLYSDSKWFGSHWEQTLRGNYRLDSGSVGASYTAGWGNEQYTRLNANAAFRIFMDTYVSPSANYSITDEQTLASIGVSINRSFDILGVRPRASVGFNFSKTSSDYEETILDNLIFANLTFDIGRNKTDSASVDFRSSARKINGELVSSYGVGVNKNFDHPIRSIYGSADISENNDVSLSSGVTVNSLSSNGNLFLNHNYSHEGDSRTFYGGNLSNSIYFAKDQDKTNFAISPDSSQSGLIIYVDGDAAAINDSTFALVNGSMTSLKAGSNFIALPPYSENNVSFFHDKEYFLSKKHTKVEVSLNEISSIEVEVRKTVTVIGVLKDKRGNPVVGRHIYNHMAETYTDVNGTFVLQVSTLEPTISSGEHSMLLSVNNVDESNIIYLGDVNL